MSIIASAVALVSREKYGKDGIEDKAPDLKIRHKDWKTRFWHDDDEYRGRTTRTVTVTITVTLPAASVSGDTTFPNGTSTVESGITPSIPNDLAPITLIDIGSEIPAAASSTDNEAAETTPVDDGTLVTSAAVPPTAVENPDASAAAPTPIENDLAPITLINLTPLGAVDARAPKETGK
ncbi:hypothetical protein BKA66DRAFT_569963 [Pyrenochaeta sp. MPI-SDFR-AT-0127]|nr:hypothetical protein BKA66DRAFT_569963 [Pyrenochaeta sp. MPI-SDFR-AT-0127]